jgi:hypothetical protein
MIRSNEKRPIPSYLPVVLGLIAGALFSGVALGVVITLWLTSSQMTTSM